MVIRINLYSLSQFDEALKNDTKDHSIVIELNNEEPAKNIAQQTELENINENQDRTGEVPLFLNKTSEENDINRYSLKEFYESIKNDIKDNTIMVQLNRLDNGRIFKSKKNHRNLKKKMMRLIFHIIMKKRETKKSKKKSMGVNFNGY